MELTNGTFVQSLDRGLAVIRAFDAHESRCTLSEIARRTDISRASARRFLHTLVRLGYVATDGREFWLRPRVLDLGYAYLSAQTLPQIARPHLEQLARDVGESSSLAVLDDLDIVYVERVATYRIMSATIGVGTRFPAYATSMGRAILGSTDAATRERYLDRVAIEPLTSHTVADADALRAALDLVRERGWALVDQELEEGLRSLAVPVRDASTVVAAVNVSAPVRRGDVDALVDELLPAVRSAATAIETDLAHMRGARR